MTINKFAQVGIDTPLRRLFDYRIPDSISELHVGCRVLIPFGKRSVVGIVVKLIDTPSIEASRLKNIQEKLDVDAIFNAESLALIRWAARYYQYPLGAALFSALPPALRKSKPDDSQSTEIKWLAINDANESLRRAPKQARIHAWIKQHAEGVNKQQIRQQFPGSSVTIKALEQRGLIKSIEVKEQQLTQTLADNKLRLTEDQNDVSQAIINSLHQFRVYLLEGVTGSGKTEVYFSIISQVLKSPKAQVLILVPEIGLTPQLHHRLEKHFGIAIGLLHSNITEKQRKKTWLSITTGEVRIILGTRLAVFTPIPYLQLIVVDEEHDASLKQQEGFLYHARDVAIYRAKQLSIPVILGSATPSFESIHNATLEKFQHLHLNKRAHSDLMPKIQFADMRTEKAGTIISSPLNNAMHIHLQAGKQVILFLNRRGYAPALLCHDCGWVAQCSHCDSNLTYHTKINKLICHHCDRKKLKPEQCPKCSSNNLIMLGHGTQRIEEVLSQQFPAYSAIRLDRDISRRKGSLEKILADIHQLNHQIIIGTQILSKGHDFPDVSLVGILDIDYGIHSTDFRALERSAQLLIQVAGRSGRRSTQGEVFVQTHTPDHPLLQTLLHYGYPTFASKALQARSEWKLPPFSHHIAIRARSQNNTHLYIFLEKIADIARQMLPTEIVVQGPITPAMEKKAGQFRAFILLVANQRGLFTQSIETYLNHIETLAESRKVRWSIDIDPIDNF
ncbi:MAG: primosomal protein N' [Gammaproteobacteria bacterium]|nr:primosomal protein N' [Gammaproteobacteria bacterium]